MTSPKAKKSASRVVRVLLPRNPTEEQLQAFVEEMKRQTKAYQEKKNKGVTA